MPIRTMEEAHAEIGSHFEGLRALGREVHTDFQRECRALAPIMHSRTRASLYRDMYIRKLIDYCDITPGAHFYRRGQLVLIGLESRFAFRVKRLTAGFSVGVSQTAAARRYDSNEMPEYAADLFPDAPAATLLYLGWSIPENAPQEINLYLVCNNGDRSVAWAIPLTDGDEGRGIQQPLPIEGGDDEGVGVRIRVKGNERKHG